MGAAVECTLDQEQTAITETDGRAELGFVCSLSHELRMRLYSAPAIHHKLSVPVVNKRVPTAIAAAAVPEDSGNVLVLFKEVVAAVATTAVATAESKLSAPVTLLLPLLSAAAASRRRRLLSLPSSFY